MFQRLIPTLEVVLQPDRISVRNLASGKIATAEAPFSCSHVLASDVDILEHAALLLFRQTAGSSWVFPRVKVSIPGRSIHAIERKVIRDAMLNAGAKDVSFESNVRSCDERTPAQQAYVEAAMRKR